MIGKSIFDEVSKKLRFHEMDNNRQKWQEAYRLLELGIITHEQWQKMVEDVPLGAWNSSSKSDKDKLYPFGIDDLELIDGVYQKKPPERFYGKVSVGGRVINNSWFTITPPDNA